MAMYLNLNGKPWLSAENSDYPPDGTYEVERWKWVTLYNRTFQDWEQIRNWGLQYEFPQEPNIFFGLAVEYNEPIY